MPTISARGTKGYLITDFGSRLLIPFGNDADMSYYHRRDKDRMLPDVGHFQKEWTNACKGNLKTSCDFDYNGTMAERMLLGLAAYRAGKKLEYDGAIGRVTNHARANEYLGQCRDNAVQTFAELPMPFSATPQTACRKQHRPEATRPPLADPLLREVATAALRFELGVTW